LVYFECAFSNAVEDTEKDTPKVIEEIHLEVVSQDNINEAGGVVTFVLNKPTVKDFSIYLGQTKAVCIERKNSLKVMAGIDVDTLFGRYLLSARTKKRHLLGMPFEVKPFSHKYLEKAPDMNGVELEPSDKLIKSLLWSNREPLLPLIYPVTRSWSDDFGAYYSLNSSQATGENEELREVKHLRSRISSPTTVLSPSKAVVFTVSFNEKTGYSVLLDHGMGLFSEISGLPNISIEEQDIVTQGALISHFTREDFVEKGLTKKQIVFWRVFLTKALIDPRSLIQTNHGQTQQNQPQE